MDSNVMSIIEQLRNRDSQIKYEERLILRTRNKINDLEQDIKLYKEEIQGCNRRIVIAEKEIDALKKELKETLECE